MSDMVCCPLESGDGESAECHSTSVVRAAKDHWCCECCEAIVKGTRHEVVRGMWDGSWSRYRTCLSCVEIRNHFACSGWIYGQIWSDIEANFFPDMKAGGPCMAGLSPEAKARLFDRRLKWMEDSR